MKYKIKILIMKYILFLLLIITALGVNAQDILVMKTGDELKVKVLEVNPAEVKYRLFNNPEGPIISVLKSNVFMIKYESGAKDVFSSIPASTNPEITPVEDLPIIPQPVNLNGPRIGVTIVSGELAERLDDEFGAYPVVTQFGWQFETRFFTLPDGLSGVFELVPLIAGVEQGLFLPSISGLIGLRTGKGLEFGVGPNVSLAGAALVIAGGVTISSQYVHFPINFAVVPSNKGARFSLLFGFNYRKN